VRHSQRQAWLLKKVLGNATQRSSDHDSPVSMINGDAEFVPSVVTCLSSEFPATDSYEVDVVLDYLAPAEVGNSIEVERRASERLWKQGACCKRKELREPMVADPMPVEIHQQLTQIVSTANTELGNMYGRGSLMLGALPPLASPGACCIQRRDMQANVPEMLPTPPPTPLWPKIFNHYFESDKYMEHLNGMDICEIDDLKCRIPKLGKLLLALFNLGNASAEDWEEWGYNMYGDCWAHYYSDSDPEPCHDPPD